MACVAVNSLVRTLELEFMQPRPRPIFQEYQIIPSNIDLIQSLHQKLQSLIDLFDESRMDCDEAIKHLETQLRDVAFTAEDEIELLIVQLYEEEKEKEEFGIAALFGEKLQCILQKAIKDIDGIKEAYEQARVSLQGRKTTHDAFLKSDDDKVIMNGDSDSQSEDKMVGKNDEFDTLRKMLIQHPSTQLEVVSIEGMGGIGKTRLARRIYDDSLVASHFDKRAWVVASQNHDEKKMLIDLLKSMGIQGDHLESMRIQDDNLALKQGLMGQRYLVVIDDLWSTRAWDAVQGCFPDDGNGSRVLLTTRLAEVTNYTRSNNDFSHQMQLLNQSECWDLFHQKAYRSGEAEFERIARPIVEKCKGLPLAVIVAAGLFSKLNTLNEWRNIADTLHSSATTTIINDECSGMLFLSYNHMPHNLRACFLYLGVFPEDQEIKASELASLWAAEGLVKASKDESFDTVAERHMVELVDRNLIIVWKRSKCGKKMKRFKMHDLLHAFCESEAHKENLLLVVRENNDFNLPQTCFRWVSIQLVGFEISTPYFSLKRCRSILLWSPRLGLSSLNLDGFSVLRVLYCSSEMKSLRFPRHEDVAHVRFLQLANDADLFKLVNAWNLQTVEVDDAKSLNSWEFPQLQVFRCFLFNEICFPKFQHPNLQEIFCFDLEFCTEEFFLNNPCLKKATIYFKEIESNDCIKNLTYLPELQQLESLHFVVMEYNSPHKVPINNIGLLKNLKKLHLSWTKFEWKEIYVLCKLKWLEVLWLANRACVGEEWELPENEQFCQLVYLEIDSCDLKHWKANGDHFPNLKRLVLIVCKELEEIPIEFEDISTLKLIELYDCLPSAVASAKQIEEQKHEIGDDDFVVIEKNTLKVRV